MDALRTRLMRRGHRFLERAWAHWADRSAIRLAGCEIRFVIGFESARIGSLGNRPPTPFVGSPMHQADAAPIPVTQTATAPQPGPSQPPPPPAPPPPDAP